MPSATQYVGWAAGDPNCGYATILYTTNAGADWVRQGSSTEIADVSLACIAAVDAQTAWAVGESAQGYATIYNTTNGGSTWSRQGARDAVGNNPLSKISACSREVAWVSGAAGTVLRTTDGGQTWQNLSPAGYSNYFQGITALDADIAWAAGHFQDGYAPILHTTNGGLTWVRQSCGAVTNMANILSIGAADAQRLWAVGFATNPSNNGRIIGTTNGGITWDLLYHQGAGYHANELHVVNTAKVYVAFDSFVINTADGGQSWTNVGISSTPYATMGVCAPDGRNVWAASINWTGGFIYHLSDGSADWIDQTPTNGIARISYISLVRQPDPASQGTLAIAANTGNGIWTLHGPPVGYTGPLCGTGSLAAVQAPGGYYTVSFAPLPCFRTPPNQTAWVAPGQDSVITGLYLSRQIGDYDGDGKTDATLYNCQSGDWALRLSGSNYQYVTFNFGGADWTAVAGDFDGDGRYDPCVVHKTAGLWVAMMSENGYTLGWLAGAADADAQPVRGDFDGDAKADAALFREADGLWRIRLSSQGYTETSFPFGGPGSTPLAGDFDGDGKADPGIYAAAEGRWQFLLSSLNYTSRTITLGNATDHPAPADYDGDRKTDPAVYNEETGAWTLLYSGNSYTKVTRYCGWRGFQPVSGDFDGDDLADPAVYSPTLGLWISLLSTAEYTSGDIWLGSGSFLPVW
ncbi:MAG: hypothetical protein KKG09_08090 [Verrucomicrobia bacterium]|nr:hypothetical protein [Verrucomicrobiota bacterium]MBU4428220.1 hypothetical protein [Verrucomicrobiota bacterium]MBU4497948.1 hypothetical protein [Verrucomicrobiota bacterium]